MAMRAHRTSETDAATPYILLTPGVVDVDLSTFPTDDGKPMAEDFVNQVQMIGLQYAVRQLLEAQGRTDAAIGGNQFLYYNPHNKRDNLSPDVYVALDVKPGGRAAWFTWLEGKAPDIVFEITSWTTRRQDLSAAPRGKRTLYGRMGVREYYVYNPGALAPPSLRVFTLQGEGVRRRLEEAPLLSSGGVRSTLLAAELRPVWTPGTEWEPAGMYLRVIDPTTGAPFRVGEEIRQDYRAARAQVENIGERLIEAEQARLEAEQARLEAEERARLAEEALESLRAARTRLE